MTEINTTSRTGQQQAQQQAPQQQQAQQLVPARRRSTGPEPSIASANRLPGLASGINTEQTIEKIMAVERRRLRPIEEQRAETVQELQAFDLINQSLEKINGTVNQLKGAAVWEAKIIDSSNEELVTATANAGAKPGKHTLVVDRLALNHQIASQGYESQSDAVGTGKFVLTVGEEGTPVTVVIDESNNTLTGLKDAINFATDEVNATIIKTGSRTAPYQLVLTSQKTGSEGRVALDVQLEGGITPNFQNSVEQPSPWKGVGEPTARERDAVTGTGASTAIVDVIGEYTGEEERTFTFTAIQNGVVGEDNQLQLRWKDNLGNNGVLNLDALNYAPGEPLEFEDGLALVFSEGEIIVNDSFSFTAHPEKSDLEWWVAPERRDAFVTRPTAWSRQLSPEFGAPIIEGPYTGAEDQQFTLSVEGSGQVGNAQDLRVRWRNEEGEEGVFSVGRGYEPGTPLGITDGLTLTVKPGVLSDGQQATFDVVAQEESGQWWRPQSERIIPAEIRNVSNWSLAGAEEDEPGGFMPELPEGEGPRVSTTQVALSGQYIGDEAKVFTFTALRNGAIGTTRDLRIRWDDSKGNAGELNVGENYEPGTPLSFADGLSVAFGPGRVFEEDEFTVRTRTSTVQPAQDALIRFGATELGGGLEITSPTNELGDVIDGVTLNLVAAGDEPVTITIRGDTEQAFETVKTFVQQYNELASLIAELTKFDEETEIAGPLLGNREVTAIQNTLAEMLTNPVAGLPQSTNMLLSLGAAFNDNGLLELDESKLQSKIEEDFAVVADMFRNKGESDNSSVAFVGMTEETRVNTEGYPVDITRPATQGSYQTPPLVQPIRITSENNRVFVNVDGRQSEQLVLEPGSYSVGAYARLLQDAITDDEVVGNRKVRVLTDGNRIKVISGRFGTTSAINFTPSYEDGPLPPGLMNGDAVTGTDVQGTIDGNAAEGNGQLLRAPEESGPAAGLRLFVKLPEAQLNPAGPEAAVVITKGIASRVGTYLETMVDPLTGEMGRIKQNLRSRVGDLDTQLDRLEERIAAKRERLQGRFARLESQMSTLKQQQSFMQSQLGSLGGGGGMAALMQGLPG